MSFSSNEEEMLIESISNYPALYNLSHKDYKNILMKDQMWLTIAASLKKPTELVKARWKSIRDTYNKRRKRLGTGSPRVPKKPWALEAHLSFLETVENERKSSTNVTLAPNEILKEDDEDNDSDDENLKDSKDSNVKKRNYQENDDHEDVIIDDADDFYDGDRENDPVTRSENNNKPCVKKLKIEENYASSSSSTRTPTRRKEKVEDILMNQRLHLYKSLHQISNMTVAKTEDPIDLFFKSVAAQVKGLPPQIVPDLRMKITNLVCECEKFVKFNYGSITPDQQHQGQNLYHSNFSYPQAPSVPPPMNSASSSSTDPSVNCLSQLELL